MERKQNILIVGAGITGLVCALELLKKGYNVTVIEKENKVGGLARSFNYENMIFDIGPHRFFSNKASINDYILKIFNNDYIVIQRKSAVLFENKYFSWPLNILSVFKMSFKNIVNILKDILFLEKKEIKNYEDFVKNKYGKTLYEAFFKDYAEKFFNIDAKNLSYVWAKESIDRVFIVKKMTTIFSVILYFIKNSFIKEKKFFYSNKKGIQLFADNLFKQIVDFGGKINCSADVNGIEIQNNKIVSISFNKEKEKNIDKVIWTAPITTISSLLNIKTTLEYTNLVLFNIIINGKNIKTEPNMYQWCYYGSKKILLNRISKPVLFSINNVSNNKDSVCVEVSCSNKDKIWISPDIVKEKIIKELILLDVIKTREDISEIFIEKIENVYPVYKVNFQNELNRVNEKLKTINNLYLAGRSGLFWYNNMDDSIENALTLSKKIYEDK